MFFSCQSRGTFTLRAGGLFLAHRILMPPPSPQSVPSPHDGEVGRGSGRGFQKSATIRWNEPLSPLVPRRERGHFSDGGCIKMRPSRGKNLLPAPTRDINSAVSLTYSEN